MNLALHQGSFVSTAPAMGANVTQLLLPQDAGGREGLVWYLTNSISDSARALLIGTPQESYASGVRLAFVPKDAVREQQALCSPQDALRALHRFHEGDITRSVLDSGPIIFWHAPWGGLRLMWQKRNGGTWLDTVPAHGRELPNYRAAVRIAG